MSGLQGALPRVIPRAASLRNPDRTGRYSGRKYNWHVEALGISVRFPVTAKRPFTTGSNGSLVTAGPSAPS